MVWGHQKLIRSLRWSGFVSLGTGLMLATRPVFALSLVRHNSHFVGTVISMSRACDRSTVFQIVMACMVIGLKRLEQVVKIDVVPKGGATLHLPQ